MPGTPIPVSIASDMTLPLVPPPITMHDFVPIPGTPPAPPLCMAIESPVAVLWGPGFALFQNKLTTTVIHQGMPFALDGHDCGYMIPHVTVPVNNARLPIIIMFSGRKMAFAATTVKANGAGVACSTPMLFPMLCCGFPVTLPTGFPPANSLNTVTVGMTPADIIFGIVGIAATIAGDILTYSPPSLPDMKEILFKVLLGDSPRNWLIKQGLGAAAGLARIAITGEGSVQIQVGSSYAGVTVGYSRSADGSYSVGATGQLGVPVGPVIGGQVGAQYSESATGESSTTTSHAGAVGAGAGPLASGGAMTSSSTTSTTDASGATTETTTTTDQTAGTVPMHGASSASTTTTSAGAVPVRSGYRGGHAQGKPWGKPL